MQSLWPDTFVEESNLTQNISQLRRALGDEAADAQYIETIPSAATGSSPACSRWRSMAFRRRGGDCGQWPRAGAAGESARGSVGRARTDLPPAVEVATEKLSRNRSRGGCDIVSVQSGRRRPGPRRRKPPSRQ